MASSKLIFRDEKSYVNCVQILQDIETEISGYFHKTYGMLFGAPRVRVLASCACVCTC